MKLILLVKKLLGLVVMTFGLVNDSFSLSKWQAVKMIFFAPCTFCMREVYLYVASTYFVSYPQIFPLKIIIQKASQACKSTSYNNN